MVPISKKENSRHELIQYVTNHQAKLYQLAYSYLHDEQYALDVIQDAIEKSLRKITILRNPEYVKTWFYRILVNECLTNIKRRKYKEIVNIEDYDIPYEEKEQLESREIYEAVDKLNPKLKTIVILRFFEDMKFEDIALITGVNINTVKSRLYKALKELKMDIIERDCL